MVVAKPKMQLLDPIMTDFYKYAAGLANPLHDQKNLSGIFGTLEDIPAQSTSELLEPTYQELTLGFHLQPGLPKQKRLALKSDYRHYSEPLSAASWHQALQKGTAGEATILIIGKDQGGWCQLCAQQILVFYAYRLRNKSWQVKADVDPTIRYFHAVIKERKKTHNLLYWLRVDEANNPVNGEFLDLPGEKENWRPWALIVQSST
jgi:hypothetical protein